jgi:hypothetical protein
VGNLESLHPKKGRKKIRGREKEGRVEGHKTSKKKQG